MTKRCFNCGEEISSYPCPICHAEKPGLLDQGGYHPEKPTSVFNIDSFEYIGYVRAFFRSCGFIFLSLGTLLMFGPLPFLKFIPLFVLSVGIMSSPSDSVSSDEEVGLSVLKMILGILMVITFGYIFSDISSSNPTLFWSLILIASGFFITIPSVDVQGRNDVSAKMLQKFYEVGERLSEGVRRSAGEKDAGQIGKFFMYLVIILVFVTLVVFLLSITAPDISVDLTKFFTIGIGIVMAAVSVGIGFLLGRNVNGIILGALGGGGLALSSVSFLGQSGTSSLVGFVIFSSVVGLGILASVPVDKAKTFIGVPILVVALASTAIAYPDIMGEAVFGDWWPTIDYNIDQIAGPIMENLGSPLGTLGYGYSCLANPIACYQDYKPKTYTKRSIKAVEVTDLQIFGNENIEKPGEVLIIGRIENKGDRSAYDISITPIEPYYTQGTLEEERILAGTVSMTCEDGNTANPSCPLPKLIPGEMREIVLRYNIDNLVSGNYVSYGVNISYDLSVEGLVDVMIMNKSYYYRLDRNGKLDVKEQVTEDTGGPVRLGIALMRNNMPVRDDLEEVPVMLYLENVANGYVDNIKYARVDVSDIEGTEDTYCEPSLGDDNDLKLRGLAEYMDGNETIGKPVKAICISRIPNIDVEQKTFALTGLVNYTYVDKIENKMKVSFGSYMECICQDPTSGQMKTLRIYECGSGNSACSSLCGSWNMVDCREPSEGDDGDSGDGGSSCTDSDNGPDHFNKGTATGTDGIGHTDSCSGDQLTEWDCDGDSVSSHNYNCMNGCSNGKCNSNNYVDVNCTDYDGGYNYYRKSRATEGDTTYNDCCMESSGGDCLDSATNLAEAVCEGGSATRNLHNCPNGCSNGKCVK